MATVLVKIPVNRHFIPDRGNKCYDFFGKSKLSTTFYYLCTRKLVSNRIIRDWGGNGEGVLHYGMRR